MSNRYRVEFDGDMRPTGVRFSRRMPTTMETALYDYPSGDQALYVSAHDELDAFVKAQGWLDKRRGKP